MYPNEVYKTRPSNWCVAEAEMLVICMDTLQQEAIRLNNRKVLLTKDTVGHENSKQAFYFVSKQVKNRKQLFLYNAFYC